ncbi:MAG: site-specific integrase [Tepidanaerobacter acetatoxydans]|jgi:integrase|uniref:tyrosine-type recombinase/integrase n=1 Tax=Tepidanaerobacter acetatoxydans TaxID=499229 RepID=UPI0026F3369C|nr:tyrosine-type recombinase/integrase [Tepidanaerobacter acetatoxydans]NLU09404.1 site-specific integrase [Tepidanaerobacter acetatoxydans]
MATIQKYKTDKGFRWRVRWRTEEGKQKSKTFDRQRLAKDFLTKLEHEMREGSYVEPSSITLREFLESWIESYKINISPNTERGYRVNIKHICSILGDKPLQKIIPADIETAYAKLGQTLSGTSILYIHRTLSRALKQAERQRLINRNSCDFVETPKKNKNFKAKFVHPDDIGKYLNAFKGHYLYIAVCLAMFCGLRRGEVLGLQWKDIDWKASIINIRHNMTDEGLKAPKSGETRTIPLTEAMKEILKEQKRKQQRFMEMLWDEYYRSDFVVTYDDGTLIKPRALSKNFAAVLRKANLELVRFHDLRHTAASLMIHEGVELKTVSEILGHSSISITADIYGHVIEEKKKQAAQKLDKYIK